MLPKAKVWYVHEKNKVKANRTGFVILPDFSGTAHMVQGTTLVSAIVDCLEAGHAAKLTNMLAAYVGLSRVKLKRNVLIMQAFSPGLFGRGPPPGPNILMRLLRGEIQEDQVDEEFTRFERVANESSAETSLLKMHWTCTSCKLLGEEDWCKPMADFNVHNDWHFCNKLLPEGAWARCAECNKKRRRDIGAALGAERGAEANDRCAFVSTRV